MYIQIYRYRLFYQGLRIIETLVILRQLDPRQMLPSISIYYFARVCKLRNKERKQKHDINIDSK